jgi:hypothetical protein
MGRRQLLARSARCWRTSSTESLTPSKAQCQAHPRLRTKVRREAVLDLQEVAAVPSKRLGCRQVSHCHYLVYHRNRLIKCATIRVIAYITKHPTFFGLQSRVSLLYTHHCAKVETFRRPAGNSHEHTPLNRR